MRTARLPMILALLAPVPAFGQGAPPTRNANVFNGTAHQPTQGQVDNRQSAAGVAAPAGRVEQENHDLDRIDRQLRQGETRSGAVPVPP